VVQQLFRRFGGVAMRLLALSLMVVASLGLISAGPTRGVSAQELGLSVDPGMDNVLVSELVVAPDAQVIGEEAFVVVEELSYRDGPGLDSAVIDLLPYGTTGVITDGPVTMDGYTWFEFDIDGYGAPPGWVAGEFLATEEGSSDGTGIAIGSEVIVAADDLHLRDEPGLAGATLAVLPIAMPLTVLDGPVAADGYTWYLVQASAEVGQGWIAGEFVVASPGLSTTFGIGETVVINGDELNLRDAPSLTGEVVAQLALGTEVTITGGPLTADGYNWYQIGLTGADGDGWVAGEFLAYP
jgi:uncharacterized protein YgiM (DUF1202 family)